MSNLIWSVIIIILSAIPLNIAVKILGGKTNILKTVFIVFISGLVIAFIETFVTLLAGLIAFIAMIAIYHYAFRLKWWKALVAWLLQFVIIGLFILLLFLLGIGLIFF